MPLPKDHNKLVYPQPLPAKGQTEGRIPGFRGLTLLDQLATAALPVAQRRLESLEATFLDRPPVRYQGTAAEVAAEAYNLAEAMLQERQHRLNAELSTENAAPAAPQP